MSTNSLSGHDDEWISQAEAARVHGVSRQAISKMVRAGRLRTFEIGGHILVSRIEVSSLKTKESTPSRERPDEVSRFLSTFDQLPKEAQLEVFRRLKSREPQHPLEDTLGASATVILDALERSGPMMLRGLRGVMAESAFGVYVVGPLVANGWSSLPTLKDPPYDFLLDDGQGPVKVQVKLQRSKDGQPWLKRWGRDYGAPKTYVVEPQRSRSGSKNESNTRPYQFEQFDVLAVSIYPLTKNWSHFRYTVGNWLVPRSDDVRQIDYKQPLTFRPDDWTESLVEAVQWFRTGVQKTIKFAPAEADGPIHDVTA